MHSRRRGFTLIELLVVLAILAAATTVALRSTSRLQERNRFDATQRVLADIERAVVGHASDVLGDLPLASFVADMGRLPRNLATGVPGTELRELWILPQASGGAAAQASAARSPANDPEVVVQTGWRGPYVDLPIGYAYDPSQPSDDLTKLPRLLDGYGKPFQITEQPNLWLATSAGDDDVAGSSDDLGLTLIDDAQSIDRVHATLAGTVTLTAPPPVGGWMVTVIVYGPDPDDGGLGEFVTTAAQIPGSDLVWKYAFDEADGLTVGSRAARAYVHGPGSIPQKTALKSRVHRLKLLPQGNVLAFDVVVTEVGQIDVGGGGF